MNHMLTCALLAAASVVVARDMRSECIPLDMEMVKRNGYISIVRNGQPLVTLE